MKFKLDWDLEDLFMVILVAIVMTALLIGLGFAIKAASEQQQQSNTDLEQIKPLIEMAIANKEGCYFSSSGWWIYYDMGTKKLPLDDSMFNYATQRLKESKEQAARLEIEMAKKFLNPPKQPEKSE